MCSIAQRAKLTKDKGDRGSCEKDGNESQNQMTLLLNDMEIRQCFELAYIHIHKSAATYPQRKPDSVQDGRNNKVPTNTMDSDFMSRLEPLVDHETAQKEVDERPDIKDPGSFW